MTLIKLVPSQEQVNPGDIFSVEIRIEPSVDNIVGMQLDLHYNPEAIQVNSYQEGNFLNQQGDSFFWHPEIQEGLIAPIFGAVLGEKYCPNNGTFVVFNCTALEAGNSNFIIDNIIVAGWEDDEAIELPFELEVTQVDVALSGDLNADGIIDIHDLEKLALSFGESGKADLNKDGIVNVLDAVLIAKKIIT